MADAVRGGPGGRPHGPAGGDETANLIGIAVANVAAVVDPSLIVLGGALIAQAEPLVQEVRTVVERISRAPVRDRGLRAGQGRAALGLPAGGREGSAPPRAAAARRDADGREVKEER